ncbi:MAG: [FeFe] hydrogenase H-cluster radical SAM maturase HydG [Candidatus Omnitrophica bacterium]|nr:[FeFe] hydrogenase H-cluster radical SAM maturase HydG [Candidatus Omnitrophota bacterium]MDD5236274.1 [FeFe] hydrogenase H-cluster radical SAM maturase HydG [Candidatus Omnitrophota bacterium]MDD5611193.1 [FeFe] hydrogenase H-cluster radical SAM maturase HydG [Candidatus Omnitrophota bacterium]
MRYIDQNRIKEALKEAKAAEPARIDSILKKSKSLKRLSLEETAALLVVKDKDCLAKIFSAATYVKDAIYGKRIVLFAPLYVSNVCVNTCLYCAFKGDNKLIERKVLTQEEVRQQIEWLLKRGHKRILLVAGELVPARSPINYYCETIRTIYAASTGKNKIKRVNINCAPLSVEDFRKLKESGIGTYQVFQETYHEQTYRYVHPSGPKSDPDNRLDAVDRAFTAGIDDVGLGVLYGLYDYQFETLGLLMHIEHLEEKFGVGPHTISVPRIEPAIGADFTKNIPYQLSDEDFKKVVAVLRLAVPYTGMILSTRETPQMRNELVNLGISQISAESRTAPGGYSTQDNNLGNDTQFCLSDQRSLDEVIGSLIKEELIPSFCAACYRKERTGEVFMSLAKPGAIKEKCDINALITLKEYLDDFASSDVKKSGYKLINAIKSKFSKEKQDLLNKHFTDIDKGTRDTYI